MVLGSQVKGDNKSSNEASTLPDETNADSQAAPAPAKKIIGINEPQICKNKGCGKTFTEMENHDTACNFHPGPPVFHDRLRGVRYIYLLKLFHYHGASKLYTAEHDIYVFLRYPFDFQWKCCDIHVKEFDEFMEIQPCTRGWHNADPA